MKLRKILSVLTVALLVCIFTFSQLGYGITYVDDLRQKRAVESKGDIEGVFEVKEATPENPIIFETETLQVPQQLTATLGKLGLSLARMQFNQVAGGILDDADPFADSSLVLSLYVTNRANIATHFGVGCGKDNATGKRIGVKSIYGHRKNITDGGAVTLLEEDIRALAEALDIVIIIGGSEGKQRDNAPSLSVKQVFNPNGAKGIYIVFADPVEGTNMMAMNELGAWTAFAFVGLPKEKEQAFREAVAKSGKSMQEFLNKTRGAKLARLGLLFVHDAYITSFFARSPKQPLDLTTITPDTLPIAFYEMVAQARGIRVEELIAQTSAVGLARPRHAAIVASLERMGAKHAEVPDGDLVPAMTTGMEFGVRGTIKPGGAGGATEQWIAALATAGRKFKGMFVQFILRHTTSGGLKDAMGRWAEYTEEELKIFADLGITNPTKPITPQDLVDYERTVVLAAITGARPDIDLPASLAQDVNKVTVEGNKVIVKSIVVDKRGRVFIATTEYISADIKETELAVLASNNYYLPERPDVYRYAMKRLAEATTQEEIAMWLHRLEIPRKTITQKEQARLQAALSENRPDPLSVLTLEPWQTAALTGRELFDALKETEAGRKAVIMATNIRSSLSLPGIIKGAQKTNSVVVFQQAMSELDYTWPLGYLVSNAYRFVREVREACHKMGFYDYVIKGDHLTVKVDKAFLESQPAQAKIEALFNDILAETGNASRKARFFAALGNAEFMSDVNVANAMEAIKKAYDLLEAEIDAGMTIFALDASFMPMRLNTRISAFLAGFIPDNCSIEAEVGEIGGENNSTVADALEFITGVRYQEKVVTDEKTGAIYSELVLENEEAVKLGLETPRFHILSRDKGLLGYGVKIARLAINNGTAHGNNYDAQGNLIETAMNLKMTAAISKVLEPYGIGIVQHGITGTPLENIPALRSAGILEGHVGTNWQNKIWEVLVREADAGSTKAKAVVDSMINMLISKYGKKYEVVDRTTADTKKLQILIGKELKNVLGAHKAQLEALPKKIKAKIDAVTARDAAAHFKAFGSVGTAALVRDYTIRLSQPSVLEGGRDLRTIATGLITILGEGNIAAELANLKAEFLAYNTKGKLADFLADLLASPALGGLDLQKVDDGIEKVLSNIGLTRVEREEVIIILPASEIMKLSDMQALYDFLTSSVVKGKAVVIVSNDKSELDLIKRRFLSDTHGKNLEELAWLKMLSQDLGPLVALYNQYGRLDISCSLEKIQNKALSEAIKRGV